MNDRGYRLLWVMNERNGRRHLVENGKSAGLCGSWRADRNRPGPETRAPRRTSYCARCLQLAKARGHVAGLTFELPGL